MDKVKEFLMNISDFLDPYWDKIHGFFGKGWNIIYAGILLLLVIFVIVGLIKCLIKLPKTFILIIILIAGICTATYFLIYKESISTIVDVAYTLKL